MDLDDSGPRWRTLCSSLKNGICEKRKYFGSGLHHLTIQVIDEAGNMVGQNVNFVI